MNEVKAYFIIYKDKCPDVLTKRIYYSHIDHLRQNKKAGKLFIAGPLKDQDIVIQIIRATNQAEAEKIVNSDAYIISGYYQSFECYEWIEVDESNNWLMDSPRISALLKNLAE